MINYGATGVYGGEQNPADTNQLKFKFNIGTDEIREIVSHLNKDPFNENFTLVSQFNLIFGVLIRSLIIDLIEEKRLSW